MTTIDRRVSDLEKRVGQLEKIIPSRIDDSFKFANDLESYIVENIDKLSIPKLVLFSLKIKKAQTRKEIQETLESWGKVTTSWFRGGNLKNRLLKTGNVTSKINDDGKEVYSLTGKGSLRVKKLIDSK